ncbi:MAG: PorT family protein, partial [Muribaculaceae bacterium]|nr:PorT family protein [Muribaculaceae bacterium]
FGRQGAECRDHVTGAVERQDIKTAYVVAPLDLKISGDRLHNSRPYVTLGAMGTFDVSKKRSEFLQFNSTDLYLSIGLGCDFYLPFFKLNPEIKFCFGLTDILKHDRPDLDENPEMLKITQSLSKVKSKMFVLTFYFE